MNPAATSSKLVEDIRASTPFREHMPVFCFLSEDFRRNSFQAPDEKPKNRTMCTPSSEIKGMTKNECQKKLQRQQLNKGARLSLPGHPHGLPPGSLHERGFQFSEIFRITFEVNQISSVREKLQDKVPRADVIC